jgi:hypothetical protein
MKVGIPDKLEVYQSCMLDGNIVASICNEQDGRPYLPYENAPENLSLEHISCQTQPGRKRKPVHLIAFNSKNTRSNKLTKKIG